MLQRVIGAVLVVLGLLSAGLAVASATIWRPDEVVTASSTSEGAATMLVVEPGVLGLVSDDVTVTARRSDGGEVVVALGREVDVRGWVGEDAHLSVTGLASWDTLATQLVPGSTTPVEPGDDVTTEPSDDESATPAPVVGTSGLVGPDPSGSDMWFTSASGDGSAGLPEGTALDDGRSMLLVASVGDGAPAPVLTLSWQRDVSVPWLVPGLVLGGVLVIVGLAALVAASRGGLRAVGAITRRSILESTARTAATLARRGGTRTTSAEGEASRPDAPGTGDRPVTPVDATASAPGAANGPVGGAAPAGSAASRPGAAHSPATTTPAGSGPSTGAGGSPYAARTSAPTSSSAAEPTTRPLTRRELREQAERAAALAAQEKARRRPRTGALPVVRAERASAAAEPDTPAAAPAPTPEDSGTARADAWRRAWGFEQQAWTPAPHGTSPARTEEDDA